MIRFIYGDHGNKKTQRILEMIKNDTQNGIHTFLIVPDQEALQYERLTLSQLDPSCQLELEILGFSRLYNRVCREYGDICYSYVTKPIRYLLMWKTLRELRSTLETLSLDSKKDIALEDILISSINELKINGISARDLENAASGIKERSPELSSKISDIAAIYEHFDLLISEKYSDSADDLSRLRDKLDKHSFFRGANVYVDSFTSFTPIQHQILDKIFESAQSTTVTIPVAKSALDAIDAKSISASVNRMLRSAKEVCEPEIEIVKSCDDTQSAIQYLAENIWNIGDEAKNASPNPEGRIILETCDTPYSEAEAVSAHIRALLAEGARCRDIVIIARNADSYRGIIDQSLRKSNIPFYYAESYDVYSTAAVKFIISALRIKLYNWQKSDVISFIKTGLCDIPTSDANLFEEYVSTWNIRGAQFREGPWTMSADGFSRPTERGAEILAAANRVREKIVPALERFFIMLDASASIDGMCKAIYEFTRELSLEEKLTELSKKHASYGDLKMAQETARLYGMIINSLADIGTALEGEKATDEELIGLLKSVFDKTAINTIPTSIDEVTVGSANMLRTKSPKYAFVLGLCEGKFPAKVKDDGIFSESDKAIMSELDIVFDSNTETRSSDELMYVKRSFGAPTERLYAFTHKAEIDGTACFKSLAFTRIEALFSISAHEYSEADFDYLCPAPKNAAMSLRAIHASEVEKKNALCKALEPYISGIKAHSSASIKTVECYANENILEQPNKKNTFSATSFEAYVKCPFNYFCRYSLKLREKATSSFEMNNIGSFIHEVLEHVIKQLVYRDKNAEPPTDEEIIKLTDVTVTNYLNSVCPKSLLLSKRLTHLYSRLKRLSILLARSIIKEFSDSDFYPAAFELYLNGRDGTPTPLTFTLNSGATVSISGIVDRVDLYKKNSTVYVRIVDYKTGAKEFDLDDLQKGLNTQMLLYLYTICRNGKAFIEQNEECAVTDVIPAGIVYLSSSVTSISPVDYQPVEDTEKQVESALSRSGILLDDKDILAAMSNSGDAKINFSRKKKKVYATLDEFNDIYCDLEKTIIKISENLEKGIISAKPIKSSNSPCEYCTSKPICRNVQK